MTLEIEHKRDPHRVRVYRHIATEESACGECGRYEVRHVYVQKILTATERVVPWTDEETGKAFDAKVYVDRQGRDYVQVQQRDTYGPTRYWRPNDELTFAGSPEHYDTAFDVYRRRIRVGWYRPRSRPLSVRTASL